MKAGVSFWGGLVFGSEGSVSSTGSFRFRVFLLGRSCNVLLYTTIAQQREKKEKNISRNYDTTENAC
jgi:hypothetical protein